LKFHRYGSLNAINYKPIFRKAPAQEGFHTPPVKKGIYAFPQHIDESFLWAWKFPRKKGESEEERSARFVKWHRDIHRTFEYDGMIWHHLNTRITDPILEWQGSWILTDIRTYKKCLQVQYARDLRQTHQPIWPGDSSYRCPNRYNPYRANPNFRISIDHLEVFIEKKDMKGIR